MQVILSIGCITEKLCDIDLKPFAQHLGNPGQSSRLDIFRMVFDFRNRRLRGANTVPEVQKNQ
jgi:hypothetical protein